MDEGGERVTEGGQMDGQTERMMLAKRAKRYQARYRLEQAVECAA